MSWNVEAAIHHLKTQAKPRPNRQCGTYVRMAINAGGLNVPGSGSTAAKYGPNLTGQGFQLIESCEGDSGNTPWTTSFRKGDVVIYDSVPAHSAGHAQMYTGSQWISDYKQNGFWCYTHTRPPIRIYRYPVIHPTPTPNGPPAVSPDIPGASQPPWSPPAGPGGARPSPNPPRANAGGRVTPRAGAPGPGSTTAGSNSYPGHLIQFGSRGARVSDIQRRLASLGWALTVDGKFGKLTKGAVVSFQQAHGLSPDGVVGRKTWAKLFPT